MYAEFKEGEKHGGYSPATTTDDNLSAFQDAGYVLTDNDLVVDIDELSPDKAKQLLKWFDIKTEAVFTKRGAHLYFNKPTGFRGAKGATDLGFAAEYKHTANTFATTVKRGGVQRETINHGMRADLPKYLKPDRKAQSLVELGDGDGRNQALFKHRVRVQRYENWRSILNFINSVVFEEPLSDSEMEELTRDTKPEAIKDGENLIADTAKRELQIVKYSGQLWFKTQDEWYSGDEEKLLYNLYSYAPDQKTRYVKEVRDQIDLKTPALPADKVYDIRLKNGVLRNGQFIDIESDDFTPYYISEEYDPDTPSIEIVDEYIDNLTDHDSDYRQFFEEILGYVLFTNPEEIRLMSKFFFFVGDGGNGKGTLLQILKGIYGGDENISSNDIEQLSDERYLNTMVGKLANLGDDVRDKPIDDEKMKILKNISTADTVSIRRLYENSFTASISATLIFTTNHILKSFEKGESYKRRVVWCPMYGKPKSKSRTFITDLTTDEALRYWVKIIVEGYMRLHKNMKFTESKIINDFNQQYHDDNNTVLEYIKEGDAEDIEGKTVPEAYEKYEAWGEENDFNVQSKRLFKETIQSELGYTAKVTKVNGSARRIFVNENPPVTKVTKNIPENDDFPF